MKIREGKFCSLVSISNWWAWDSTPGRWKTQLILFSLYHDTRNCGIVENVSGLQLQQKHEGMIFTEKL
jgi:hypothetical protein